MKSRNNLIKKIWTYLIIFSITILSFLWLFQVIFLDTYYVWVKTNDMSKIADKIYNNYNTDEFEDILDSLSFEKDVCISIVINDEQTYSSNGFSKGCLSSMESNFAYEKYKIEFINSQKDEAEYRIIDNRYQNQILIICVKLNDSSYAFVSTSLQPLSSTTNILTSQLIYVTILVLILSLLISYFISKKISQPIIKINKNAARMAKGDYDVTFDTDSSISEIVQLSNTLKEAKDELSKTDEIRRELMANISHDLKTPLTMIKAYAEMVRDLTYNDKVKRESNLNTIIEETDRLNLLVNDILELSKMQSNKLALMIQEFDMNDLIKSIIKKFDYLEEQNNYKFNYENNKKLLVKADKKQIEQVIYNLISNAVKYVGEDKQVIINIIDKKDTYRVEISDHGKGIKKDQLDLIWDKYYRTDKTHKRSTSGTGLGLSIVKSILNKHKFDYGVKSILNKGTTFYFEINKK
ncbi:MAG: HAMP domain-containing sensor histidine kinase [Bacilli bacterium]|nr:HAMP domain-containing sensor histidine kinase [Bacilli bacterium]